MKIQRLGFVTGVLFGAMMLLHCSSAPSSKLSYYDGENDANPAVRGFRLKASSSMLSATAGTKTSLRVELERNSNFKDEVVVTIQGLKDGITATTIRFTEAQQTDTIQITIPPSVVSGSYNFDVVGISSELRVQVPMTLTISPSHGSLDLSFGTQSPTGTGTPTPGSIVDALPALFEQIKPKVLAVRPTGQIIVGIEVSDPKDSSFSSFAIVQYNADGTRDRTFNEKFLYPGIATKLYEQGSVRLQNILLQNDGSLLIVAQCGKGMSNQFDPCIARLQSSGVIDTTFAGGSHWKIWPSLISPNLSISVLLDDRILVGIQFFQSEPQGRRVGLEILTPKGERAPLFPKTNGEWYVFSPFFNPTPPAFYSENLNQIFATSDNKIILVVQVHSIIEPDYVALVRLNLDTNPDTKFGDNGLLKIPAPKLPPAKGAEPIQALLSSTQDLVLHTSFSFVQNPSSTTTIEYLNRVNSIGVFDASFGKEGFLMKESFSDLIQDFHIKAMQSDNKILLKAISKANSYVMRLNDNGTLDTTFGRQGFSFPLPHSPASIEDIRIQPDGKIIALFSPRVASSRTIGLLRLWP